MPTHPPFIGSWGFAPDPILVVWIGFTLFHRIALNRSLLPQPQRLGGFCFAINCSVFVLIESHRVAVPCFCSAPRRALAKSRPLPLLRFGCFCRRQRLSCAARHPFNVPPALRARPGGARCRWLLLLFIGNTSPKDLRSANPGGAVFGLEPPTGGAAAGRRGTAMGGGWV